MSHRDEMFSEGNIANNNAILLTNNKTNGNQTNCGDHFVMYRNIKSLCCVPGTTIVLQVNYTSKTNKQANIQTHRKRDQICGYQRQGVGGGGTG